MGRVKKSYWRMEDWENNEGSKMTSVYRLIYKCIFTKHYQNELDMLHKLREVI